MASWGEFARERPDLAGAGRELLYQFGVGLAFLATIRKDTGPRLHPICPLLNESGIFAFIIPSPKQEDLRRDERFAMHSFPCENNEDAFYLTGLAERVQDLRVREELAKQFVSERSESGAAHPADTHVLFEFKPAKCMVTRTTGHGDPNPRHTVWRDSKSI
jgi:hypothetical protein